MKLYCKFNTSRVKMVEVNLTDPISILLDKLNLKTKVEKQTKFVYKGQTYGVALCLTFEEIGFTPNDDNVRLSLINQAISGN